MSENTFEARFSSLEQASRLLSLDVQSLNETLLIITQLQTEQAAQRRRQDEADVAIVAAKAEADARDARTKRVFGGVSLALIILLPVVSILVYLSLIEHVDTLLREQRANSFASCTTRNQATVDNIRREQLLAEASQAPELQKIHRNSALELNKSVVDCSKFKP